VNEPTPTPIPKYFTLLYPATPAKQYRNETMSSSELSTPAAAPSEEGERLEEKREKVIK
jgi:hypothetical protein